MVALITQRSVVQIHPPRQPLDSTGCEFRVEQTDSQSTHKVSRVRIGAPCFTLCSRRYCCQPIEQQLPDDHRIRCSLLLGDCLRVHLKRGLRKGLLLTTTVSSLNAFRELTVVVSNS